MTLTLRPYTPTDADRILSWSPDAHAFYQWCAGVLGDYPITKDQFAFVERNTAFTAVDGEEIVGFFTLRRPNENPDEWRFGFVIVDPDKRGSGYGKAMLELGINYAREVIGAKKLSLGVFENNESAYHCYKAVGFQDVVLEETEKYAVLGEEWNCLELEMQL